MIISQLIKRKVNYWSDLYYIKKYTKRSTKQLQGIDYKTPVVYYMCTPIHPNLGDQAQIVCMQNWIKENLPDHKVIECCARTIPNNWLDIMKRKIKKTDIILVHSGYLFMNIPTDVPVILKLVENFPNNKIVLFPQTVNFPDTFTESNFKQVFASHNDLTLLCRDFVSFEKAKQIFPNNKCLPFPDIVTSLIGTYESKEYRHGVCFCLRNDNEKYYSNEELGALEEQLRPYGITKTDTTLNVSAYEINGKREKYIWNMVKRLSSAKVVITDRYHGTIFSVIANTPTIVINSIDHKLSSGVKWFPKEVFGKAIQYAESLDSASIMAKIILEDKDLKLRNPPYFQNEYWSKLKEQIW